MGPLADDPFRPAREADGVLAAEFQGQTIPMLLRYKDVRAAAGDFRTFSNDAPFRVPIPSEEDVRSVRQLPIECDPPDHREYRALVDPFFRRAKEPEMAVQIEALIDRLLEEALGRGSVEIVREFALPLQSYGLAILLRVPEAEAVEWIGWGTHVFRDGDGKSKGAALEEYIRRRLALASQNPGGDFFSALEQGVFRGRPLTIEEKIGFVNLTFAGGRDTIIHTVTAIVAQMAEHPGCRRAIAEHPEMIDTATEEFFRYLSPLTHIGRVCPVSHQVGSLAVEPGERVSLCWASANRDAAVFSEPDELRLGRKPNPHIAFGIGPHNCLGAAHARLIARTLLRLLTQKVGELELVSATPHLEENVSYVRRLGFENLVVSFSRPLPPAGCSRGR
ncbi:MAG TPA: cytochrome P450 [Opitutaceae bacterium]|jgi:cytochrome P450